MIHRKEYVKELIWKYVQGTLSGKESARLAMARKIYTDEEFDRMVVEVLLSRYDDLPQQAMEDWKPDFAAIRAEGDRRLKQPHGPRDRWIVWWAAAAVLIPLVLILAHLWTRMQETPEQLYGECIALDRNMEFPVSESGFVLRWGDGETVQVYPADRGELAHVGNLSLIRESDGVLRLAYTGDPHAVPDLQYVDIATGYRQQCLIELPDGTTIRLNAQSLLRYPVAQLDRPVVTLIGEAQVQSATNSPVLIRTGNAVISTMGADFLVLTNPFYTRAILEKGEVKLHRGGSEDRVRLRSTCEQVIWGRVVSKDQTPRHQLVHNRAADLDAAKRWTKAVRHYRDTPLREYVREMERWHGLKVRDMNCIPAENRVNTVACYSDDYRVVLAAIRASGVPVYEYKGMLSFCEEEEKQDVSMLRNLKSHVIE